MEYFDNMQQAEGIDFIFLPFRFFLFCLKDI